MGYQQDLAAKLKAVEARIDQIYKTGLEYTIIGSHSVKNPALVTLENEVARITRQLAALRGMSPRRRIKVYPDFS